MGSQRGLVPRKKQAPLTGARFKSNLTVESYYFSQVAQKRAPPQTRLVGVVLPPPEARHFENSFGLACFVRSRKESGRGDLCVWQSWPAIG